MNSNTHNFDNGNDKTETAEKLSQAINSFFQQETDATKQQPRLSARGGQFFARQEVITALSKLQQSYKTSFVPGQQVNINTDTFKKALLTTMASQSNTTMTKSVNQIDGRTIDFVEMIFGAFLRDKNISNVIKTLLLKLQIPVIKISLLDNNFFHNIKHPARNMLDAIAHLGIGIEDSENTLYKTIEMIINQLLKTYDQSIMSFNTALKALERLGSNEKVSLEKNEKETQKLILKEHARQIIIAEIQFHLNGRTLPDATHQLVLRNWSTLMFHCYAKHGKNSTEWTEIVNVLKLLINTLQPPKNPNEYLSLRDNHMSLVNTVNDMLNNSNQNKELIHNAVHSLKFTYQSILENSEFKSPEHSTGISKSQPLDTEYRTDETRGQSPMERRLAESRKKIEQLPELIKPGVWFEIHTGDNRPVRRLKLSVIVQENARLIFVDRLGIKVLEKDAVDFATEIDIGKSHILADHSIFDHALTNVINSLTANQ